MWKFISLVLLSYLQISNCYRKSITLNEYSKCRKETLVDPGVGYVSTFMKFQKFVPLNSLFYGNDPRETRIKFYFQARSHFGLGLLPQPIEPGKSDPIILFEISCDKNFAGSYLYLDRGETRACNYKNFPNPMHISYFTELEIVINRQYGFVSVFLPNSGPSPFLQCYDPFIVSRLKYIGFSGRYEYTTRYIYDCPLKADYY